MTFRAHPFTTREEAETVFAKHVSLGKLATFRKYGFEAILGERGGSSFSDAFAERTWINCHSNGGVFNLGHRNPSVIAAVKSALDFYDIGNHHLVSVMRAELARRLAATTRGRLEGVVFGVGGGEAIDLAIKVTRAVTRRTKIVSARGGYHGHTGLALATGDAQYRDPFGPNLPGFVQVPFDDVASIEREVDDTTAAVLLESIPATLGMPIASAEYFQAVEKVCRARGAKLVMDEVQTGLGRTGKMWCYEHYGLEPDAIVTGKGLSGGIYPISATLMTRELHAFFDDNPFIHISTFGGAEVGCAAGLAVLDAIEAPGFLDRVVSLGDRLASGLAGLPFEIRRRGLMMGLAFPFENGGMFAAKALFDAGVFAIYANNDTKVLQFLPPLIMSDAEADELVARVRRAFS